MKQYSDKANRAIVCLIGGSFLGNFVIPGGLGAVIGAAIGTLIGIFAKLPLTEKLRQEASFLTCRMLRIKHSYFSCHRAAKLQKIELRLGRVLRILEKRLGRSK